MMSKPVVIVALLLGSLVACAAGTDQAASTEIEVGQQVLPLSMGTSLAGSYDRTTGQISMVEGWAKQMDAVGTAAGAPFRIYLDDQRVTVDHGIAQVPRPLKVGDVLLLESPVDGSQAELRIEDKDWLATLPEGSARTAFPIMICPPCCTSPMCRPH